MLTVDSIDSSVIHRRIAELIGQQRYDFWFAQRVHLTVNPNVLTVSAPNQHFVDLLASRYRTQLEMVAKEFLGGDGNCHFQVQERYESLTSHVEHHSVTTQSKLLSNKNRSTNDLQKPKTSVSTVSGRTLDDFIVSDKNRMAVFSTKSFAEPENAVGLLVLVGPPSRGKSHLLEGLKNICLTTDSGSVKHLETESFVSKFIDSLRKGKTGTFRKSVLDCSMLIVDDLDKLVGKPTCQAEFLYLLETAKQSNIKVAISMSQLPRMTAGLNQTLIERLQSGLVCTIGPLDSSGKAQLMSQFLGKLGVGLVSAEFYSKAGELLPESAREIEGIAQKVWLLGRLESRPVDLELLNLALQENRQPNSTLTIESIVEIVGGVLGISKEAIIGRSKSPILEMGRMFAYYLARKSGFHSSAEVGAYFQNRSHSTIINGANQVKLRLVSPEGAKRWPHNWKSLLAQAEQLLSRKS